MSNVLPRSKQVAVIAALSEGCSIRSTARMTGVDRETVGTTLGRVGTGCLTLLDDTMVNLPCTRLELDELWAFVGKKQRNVKATDDGTKVTHPHTNSRRAPIIVPLATEAPRRRRSRR